MSLSRGDLFSSEHTHFADSLVEISKQVTRVADVVSQDKTPTKKSKISGMRKVVYIVSGYDGMSNVDGPRDARIFTQMPNLLHKGVGTAEILTWIMNQEDAQFLSTINTNVVIHHTFCVSEPVVE